jgi:hypothetical protein
VSVVSALPPLNPVLARELKQRMRGRYVWLVVTLYLAVLAVILRWVYVAASADASFDGGFDLLASATAGRAIFQWLLFFMLLLVCFIVPGLTAAAISGERERQTLVSLQITLLRPWSIVVGKLLASLAFVVLLIVASLPLVTIPFLVGGVSVAEVVQGLVMVLATAVILACVALACSAVVRRTQGATVLAYGLTLALVLGTLIVYGAQQFPRDPESVRPRPWILALNPFAATADVVQGRNPSVGFESPFRPLSELIRLGEDERISEIIADGQSDSGEVFVGPAGQPAVRVPGTLIAPPAVPATTAPGAFVGPGPAPRFAPGFGGPMMIEPDTGFGFGGEPEPERAQLAGFPFWLVSLLAWGLLGAGAVALAVRRISLPAERESR